MKTSLLEQKMQLQGISKQDMVKHLNLSEKRFSEKLSGSCVWNTWEVMRICMLLNLESVEEKTKIFLLNSSQ